MPTPIAITPGEPAGIGPDVVIQWAAEQSPDNVIVIADRELLQTRAAMLGLSIDFEIRHVALSNNTVTPGKVDPKNAAYVLETLEQAIAGCLSEEFSGLVTGPVHKAVINQAGITFTGHTGWLRERTQVDDVVMMLMNQRLRVALLTTHIPLRAVAKQITSARIIRAIEIIIKDTTELFNIVQPRILVCGLNPHAGEQGHLGDEEQRIMAPALQALRERGFRVSDPVPADTAFTPASLENYDIVLAMYHDQGLPVIKSQGFGETVNVTLGLPFIRTSVDHGTALSLAGTGQASHASLAAAVELTREFINNRLNKS